MSKPRSILDRGFRYRPSFATDVRKTFERIRREQQEAHDKVLPLHPMKKTRDQNAAAAVAAANQAVTEVLDDIARLRLL